MNRRGIDPLGVAEGIAWLAAIVLVSLWASGRLDEWFRGWLA